MALACAPLIESMTCQLDLPTQNGRMDRSANYPHIWISQYLPNADNCGRNKYISFQRTVLYWLSQGKLGQHWLRLRLCNLPYFSQDFLFPAIISLGRATIFLAPIFYAHPAASAICYSIFLFKQLRLMFNCIHVHTSPPYKKVSRSVKDTRHSPRQYDISAPRGTGTCYLPFTLKHRVEEANQKG